MKNTSEELKKRIHEEMLVDYSNALEKNFDLAKSFIRLTNKGKIDVIIKDKINGKEQILLYLIGKLYSKEAGFSDTDDVGNKELMDELGILNIAKNKGFNLSGGERRRTEIARTLVTSPKFILLDEPFAGVDPIAVQDIQNIVKRLKEKNIGVLITDHNVHETLSITDHAYLLFEGKILKEGNSETLANDPEARKLYLGDKFRLYR